MQKQHQAEILRIQREAQRRVVEVVTGRWVNAQLSRAWASWYKQVKGARAAEEEERKSSASSAISRTRAPTLDSGLGAGAAEKLLQLKQLRAAKVSVRQMLYDQLAHEADRRGWTSSLDITKLKPAVRATASASSTLTASGSSGRSSTTKKASVHECFVVDTAKLMRGTDVISTYTKTIRYACLLHQLPLEVVVCLPDHPMEDAPGTFGEANAVQDHADGKTHARISLDREYVNELLRVRRHVEVLLFDDETLLEVRGGEHEE
jgi:hypothetical protein